MAISHELGGPNGRRDHASHAGRGDHARTSRIRKAQRHSHLVRLMRIALPAGALAIAGYYVFTLIGASNIGADLARTAIPKILPSGLAMKNARYRGQTKDGGVYVVTAKTARPHPKSPHVISMRHISGELTQKNGTRLTLAANAGHFNTTNENLTLQQNVALKSSSGGWANLKILRYESRTGLMTSDKPVELGNDQLRLTGETLKIMQKSKEMVISGSVVAEITPPAPKTPAPAAPSAAAQATSGSQTEPPADGAGAASLTRMFTATKGPINITADRLELDDVKKTAIFIGKVRAKQGETELTTPELRIAYDGAPSGGLTGAGEASAPDAPAPAADGKGKPQQQAAAEITSIVAANPVAITQAPATHMTGTAAAFDAATQRATLTGGVTITRAPDTKITGKTAGFDDLTDVAYIDGDVVLVQGSNRRATGKHAEFHSRTETALLTGDVVLTQGKNELRGRRLFIDQKAGRSELTAPPMAGSGPGRITAHFVPDASKARSSQPQQRAGSSLMSGFATDPGAPVDISAGQLEVFEQKNLAVFRGDVEAKQGDFRFRSSELNALYTGSAGITDAAKTGSAGTSERADKPAASLKRLQARGKVIVTSRNGQKATGDWADFDVAANTVTMGGKVILTQGRNVVEGTRLVIDMTTGESVINTDNSAAPNVAGEQPGSGWRAYKKPSRPSAVFFPSDLKNGKARSQAGESAITSGWSSTTATPKN